MYTQLRRIENASDRLQAFTVWTFTSSKTGESLSFPHIQKRHHDPKNGRFVELANYGGGCQVELHENYFDYAGRKYSRLIKTWGAAAA